MYARSRNNVYRSRRIQTSLPNSREKLNLRIILKLLDKARILCYTEWDFEATRRVAEPKRRQYMAGRYKTSGRERLISFLSSHPDTPYTVDELASHLHPDSPAQRGKGRGKSSLYRQLAGLVADGTVRCDREERGGSDRRAAASVYRYVAGNDCSGHIHLQCSACGRLVHLDCHLADDLLSHIRADHRFSIDPARSVLYGTCEECGGA